MAPVSTTEFVASPAVEAGPHRRWNVTAPWGRVVATFSAAEDGPTIAESFAKHEAAVNNRVLKLAAEFLQHNDTSELVLAFREAWAEAAAEFGDEELLGTEPTLWSAS